MDVRQLQRAIAHRLLAWTGISVTAGLILLAAGSPFGRAFGIQAAAWGAIDGLIAAAGLLVLRRRIARQPDPPPGDVCREERSLSRLLRINGGLDVLYVIGGLALALTLGRESAAWRGHGWGIVVQGAFLLLFDLYHAQRVPAHVDLDLPPLFQGPEHEPFTWAGGKGAVLLVHGYLGSPDEMRPLGELLLEEGWTVRGVRLPGFGAEIETLPERRADEWVEAVVDELGALQREHDPVVLIGHSLGASLAVIAAVQRPPSALVLLAPLVRVGPPAAEAIGTVLRPWLPATVRPLRDELIDRPQVRKGLAQLLPQLDMDDPETRRQICELEVPVAMIDELRRAARWARRAASRLSAPLLVLQGRADRVTPARTARQFVEGLCGRPHYREVEGGHELFDPDEPSWPRVAAEIREWTRTLRGGPPAPEPGG
jgi:carboxylesterase